MHRFDARVTLQTAIAFSRHLRGSLIDAIALRQRVAVIDGKIAWHRNLWSSVKRCADARSRQRNGRGDQKDASEFIEAHAST